jgi:hypothetical protein
LGGSVSRRAENTALGWEAGRIKKTSTVPFAKATDIVHFVKSSDVDPIYFETSYFSVPEEAGRRAYALSLHPMAKSSDHDSNFGDPGEPTAG